MNFPHVLNSTPGNTAQFCSDHHTFFAVANLGSEALAGVEVEHLPDPALQSMPSSSWYCLARLFSALAREGCVPKSGGGDRMAEG